ncbi:MAG TPA: chaperone modulator CbpM [Puia sp.]|jgi:chaperone modulatory protein CbpM|nr:chaperone modulator CbpM [Puia sp.]
MSFEELISAREFCIYHRIEMPFIQHLHEAGLIEMTIREGAFFLPSGELPALEKFVRWHYELSINSEGIEALSHVLQRMQQLLEENRSLRNRLHRYERDPGGPVEPAVEM